MGESSIFYNYVLKFENGRLESYYIEAEIDGYNACFTTFSYDEIELMLPIVEDEIDTIGETKTVK